MLNVPYNFLNGFELISKMTRGASQSAEIRRSAEKSHVWDFYLSHHRSLYLFTFQSTALLDTYMIYKFQRVPLTFSTLQVRNVASVSIQTWDWGKVKKEENDAGVWGTQ